MFSIGEFSKITGLTVKTLRFYHEQGVLTPSCVDDQNGYRYYDSSKVETALVISRLRKLEFSLSEIAEMLRDHDDEANIVDYLVRQRELIVAKLQHYREIDQVLEQVITNEREARNAMNTSEFQVEERQIEPILIAAIRMCGKYSDCGKGFATLGKKFGRHFCGKPMMLHYDCEYKENDANFEVCAPVRKGSDSEGVSVRELPGGLAVTLMHKGPYDELGRSYEKITTYMNEKGYQAVIPSREVYLKGPGMIFKGNAKNYLTEIQMLVQQ